MAGDIQIIKLARTGTAVKKGDVVAQFDTSKLLDTLNQRRSDMKQADAEIGQERAKAHLLEEQDRTDLLKAHYDVERAKLDVSQQEILSPIDAAEKKLLLADAEQKLREIEARQKSDQTSSQALINGESASARQSPGRCAPGGGQHRLHDSARPHGRRGNAVSQLARRRVFFGQPAGIPAGRPRLEWRCHRRIARFFHPASEHAD